MTVHLKTVTPFEDGLGVPTEWMEVPPYRPGAADPPLRSLLTGLLAFGGSYVTGADGIITARSLASDHTAIHLRVS